MIIWAIVARIDNMSLNGTVVASGNLATPRRTIMGVMAQCAMLEVDDETALELYTAAGLPSHALEQLDFPLSLDQELTICMGLIRTLPPARSPTVALFRALNRSGIESLGVLGMAMRHAATAIDALKVCVAYPQLTWGHSRMVVRSAANLSTYSYTMERPILPCASSDEIDSLVEYCLVLDLVTSMRNIADIVESDEAPAYINLPFAQPPDWGELAGELPCPVHFSAQEACFAFPAALDNKPLPRSNALVYRSYESIVKKQSQMLGEDFSTTERVSRWLWAYTPPPRRAEVAKLLAMSERNLTRYLAAEGTSYSVLLAEVQTERAKNFLRSPALSVAQIGYRLGYSEPAAFTRAFTGWVGISPMKWRKQN
ncbi:MAG: AraC-like DNA-binding protein [Halioglobus sp.]